jgi:hypothetical protein
VPIEFCVRGICAFFFHATGLFEANTSNTRGPTNNILKCSGLSLTVLPQIPLQHCRHRMGRRCCIHPSFCRLQQQWQCRTPHCLLRLVMLSMETTQPVQSHRPLHRTGPCILSMSVLHASQGAAPACGQVPTGRKELRPQPIAPLAASVLK